MATEQDKERVALLSEAIHDGMRNTMPNLGTFFGQEVHHPDQVIAACTLGCAWLSYVRYFDPEQDLMELLVVDKMATVWPILTEKVFNPVTKKEDYVSSIIIDLNDMRGWDRQRIYEWVQKQERLLERKKNG